MVRKQIKLIKVSTTYEHPTARIVDVRLHLEADGENKKPWIAATFIMGVWNGDVFTPLPGARSEQKNIEDLPATLKTKIETFVNDVIAQWAKLDTFKGSTEAEPS